MFAPWGDPTVRGWRGWTGQPLPRALSDLRTPNTLDLSFLHFRETARTLGVGLANPSNP
jgi:hypothetical protein